MRNKFENASLVEQILNAIRDSILAGDLQPGEHIKIKTVADKLGVSMIPVREALARLLSSRLVTIEANKGYFVASKPTATQFADFIDARVLFETSAVREGFSNVSEADIVKLKKLNNKMRKISKKRSARVNVEWGSLNHRFHKILVGITRNEFLVNIYEDLSLGSLQYQLFRSGNDSFPDFEQLIDEHDKIIESLVNKSLENLIVDLTDHIKAIGLQHHDSAVV